MGIHLFRSVSFMSETSLSSLCFVLILLLPFFLSILPRLNFYFVFLAGVQQTLNRFSSVLYLTIPSSTWTPLHLHLVSTNCPSFQLLIQFAPPNPFFKSLGQQGIYSPFFHRCTNSVHVPQAICFFSSLILLSSPTPLILSRCSHL